MRKRYVILKIFLLMLYLLFFSLTFANALTYNITNVSIKQNYSFGDIISGNFNLTIKEGLNNMTLSSTFGEMSLADFVEANGKTLSCSSYNCEETYHALGSGNSSLSVQATSEKKEFGFLFNGNNVTLSSFNFSVSSTFSKQQSNPITISIGNSYTWKYDEPSFDLTQPRAIAKGSFNESATLDFKMIGSTKYCERVSLLESKTHFLGVNISGSNTTDFLMTLKQGDREKATCNFTKITTTTYSDLNGCFVKFSQSLPSGDYEVCINSLNDQLTNYSLKSENSGQNMGYYGNSLSEFVADYSLFAVTPKYSESSGNIKFDSVFYSQAMNAINSYLQSRYSGNCTSGCVVPISFIGENITMQISNINLRYDSTSGLAITDKIYNIEQRAPEISFSGYLDIKYFNWVLSSIGNISFNLYLENEKILNVTLYVLNGPMIIRILPSEVPAGIESTIFSEVRNIGNNSIYKWSFGDNSSVVTTNKSFSSHKYLNISSYNLTLEVIDGNSSSTKSFTINAVSPRDYLNNSFISKRVQLTKLFNDLNSLSPLYRQYITNIIKLDDLKSRIDGLESQFNLAVSSEQFVNIAKELSSISLPLQIIVSERFTSPILSDPSLMNPELISQITGDSVSSVTEYGPAILGWQLNNIDSTVVKEKISLVNEFNERSDLISYYSISISSISNQPSYFVIQDGDLHFGSPNSIAKPIGSSATYFDIPENGQFNTEFFINGSKDLIMFVSPSLSLIGKDVSISACNFNRICEKNLKEDYKNCNSDCKAIWPTIWWIIIFVVFALLIYTILQVWYKMKYEKYLFKDRNELFNLITFINNARLNKTSDPDIKASLLQKGWSSEQITYAFRRADGRNPGMFEIVPIDMIVAKIEKRRAEKTSNQRLPPPINPYPIMPGRGQQPFSQGTR